MLTGSAGYIDRCIVRLLAGQAAKEIRRNGSPAMDRISLGKNAMTIFMQLWPEIPLISKL